MKGSEMNQIEAESVKDLAKSVVEVLEKVTERECSECNGTTREIKRRGREVWTDPCYNCMATGTGKVKWKWEPKVGEWCIDEKKIGLIFRKSDCWGGIFIRHKDRETYYPPDDYGILFGKAIPILHWEEIERVLEGVGYRMKLTETFRTHREFKYSVHKVFQYKDREGYRSVPDAEAFASTRQEAVMKAVIQLKKELNAKAK